MVVFGISIDLATIQKQPNDIILSKTDSVVKERPASLISGPKINPATTQQQSNNILLPLNDSLAQQGLAIISDIGTDLAILQKQANNFPLPSTDDSLGGVYLATLISGIDVYFL